MAEGLSPPLVVTGKLETMNRSIVILSTIWICLIGLLGWSEYRQVEAPECLFLPEMPKDRCEWRHDLRKDLGFPGPAYNHPNLAHFPDLVTQSGEWRDIGPEFTAKPGRVTLKLPKVTFTLRENERAAIDENAYWAFDQFEVLTCNTNGTFPVAVIYSQEGNKLSDVSLIQYVNEDLNAYSGPQRNFAIYWDARLESYYDYWRHFENVPQEMLDRYSYDGVKSRFPFKKFIEMPRSLTQETGIPKIVTYAVQVDHTNRDGEIELSTARRVILMPYQSGTLEIITVRFAQDGTQPTPRPWQFAWRSLGFPEGIPLNDSSHEDGLLANELGPYIYGSMHCSDGIKLPPRWAWPKHAPKYQLPFWPHWTFG